MMLDEQNYSADSASPIFEDFESGAGNWTIARNVGSPAVVVSDVHDVDPGTYGAYVVGEYVVGGMKRPIGGTYTRANGTIRFSVRTWSNSNGDMLISLLNAAGNGYCINCATFSSVLYITSVSAYGGFALISAAPAVNFNTSEFQTQEFVITPTTITLNTYNAAGALLQTVSATNNAYDNFTQVMVLADAGAGNRKYYDNFSISQGV